jgi:hypothetical protein
MHVFVTTISEVELVDAVGSNVDHIAYSDSLWS